MNLLRTFGIGEKYIIDDDHYINATITNIERCWWGNFINIKNMFKKTEKQSFPHIITFTYSVDGIEYAGSRYIDSSVICPHINETILIYYDESQPKRYAVKI